MGQSMWLMSLLAQRTSLSIIHSWILSLAVFQKDKTDAESSQVEENFS